MHEWAKHFSIHHLFLLLKVQFIKCSAAARGDGGGDMDDQAQRSVRSAWVSFDNVHDIDKLNILALHVVLWIPLACLHNLIQAFFRRHVHTLMGLH